MPIAAEPRDGDFVAYLDELQRESAARLAAGVTHMPAHPHKPGQQPDAHTDAPILTRAQADALRARLAQRDARENAPAAALVFGLLVLIGGFLMHGGLTTLIVGLGLIFWGVSRLARLRAQRLATPAQVIDTTFGRRA